MAKSLSNLAFAYQAQGNFGAAEPLFERALAIQEKALGPDHPRVGRALINLARLYEAQDSLSAAEAILYRSIEIMQKQTSRSFAYQSQVERLQFLKLAAAVVHAYFSFSKTSI